MTVEGRLESGFAVAELSSISPTTLAEAKVCVLRAVWHGSHEQRCLPRWPASLVGLITHSLLQQAANGQIDNVHTTWCKLASQVEADMARFWFERQLVPLANSLRDYEVRRLRACRKAASVLRSSSRSLIDGRVEGFGTELWVRSSDGKARGRIDLVQPTRTGVEIVDYKSGALWDAPDRIKEGFELQMQLYAAMYHASFGTWPTRALIVPTSGPDVAVNVIPEKCSSALAEMLRELLRLNAAVRRASDPDEHYSLAAPSPSSCKFCDCRPACSDYDRSRNPLDPDWPRDIQGIVERQIVHRNGRRTFVIRDPAAPNRESVLRGVTDSTDRHPALEFVSVGSRLSAYNCVQRGVDGSYTENCMTVVYAH